MIIDNQQNVPKTSALLWKTFENSEMYVATLLPLILQNVSFCILLVEVCCVFGHGFPFPPKLTSFFFFVAGSQNFPVYYIKVTAGETDLFPQLTYSIMSTQVAVAGHPSSSFSSLGSTHITEIDPPPPPTPTPEITPPRFAFNLIIDCNLFCKVCRKKNYVWTPPPPLKRISVAIHCVIRWFVDISMTFLTAY